MLTYKKLSIQYYLCEKITFFFKIYIKKCLVLHEGCHQVQASQLSPTILVFSAALFNCLYYSILIYKIYN